MDETKLDIPRQQKAKQYTRIRRRLSLFNLAFNGVILLLWLVFGWGESLKNTLSELTPSPLLLTAGFALAFGAPFFVLSLPLSYFISFTLPHRYGLSNQTIQGWFGDQIKGLLIGVPLGLLLIEVIYLLLRAYPETWWLWAAAILLLFNVILANLAPVLIAPLFFRLVPISEERPDLERRLIDLANQAGTPVLGVYKIDMSRRTKAANAALFGLGNTRRIVLGDTLIKEFPADEIETVMAHEMAHHVHKDLPLSILAESLLSLGGLYLASLALNWGVGALGYQNVADLAALPLLTLVMGAYSLVLMPLSNGFSRWRERLADEFALRVTENGAAYASALTRLANQNLADADPEPWVEWLFHSHPALSKRIAAAQASALNAT